MRISISRIKNNFFSPVKLKFLHAFCTHYKHNIFLNIRKKITGNWVVIFAGTLFSKNSLPLFLSFFKRCFYSFLEILLLFGHFLLESFTNGQKKMFCFFYYNQYKCLRSISNDFYRYLRLHTCIFKNSSNVHF